MAVAPPEAPHESAGGADRILHAGRSHHPGARRRVVARPPSGHRAGDGPVAPASGRSAPVAERRGLNTWKGVWRRPGRDAMLGPLSFACAMSSSIVDTVTGET